MAKAVFVGAVTAGCTFGIGEAANSLFGAASSISKAAFQTVVHGAFQGMMSIEGGKFWSSFAAGAISSIASSAFSWDGNGAAKGLGWGNSVRDSTVGMIAFGAVSGGAGAALTGGNFWQGAVTGLVVSGLNHTLHKMQQNGDLKQWLKKAGVNYSDIPNMSSEQVLDLINRVPELAQFYTESGSFNVAVNKNVDYDLTSGSTKTRFGTMTFGTDAFKSMLNLGRSIIHETGHALDLYSGNYAKFNSISDEDGFRTDVMEYRMYERELQYALPSYNRSGLNYRNEFYMRISNRGYDPDSFLKW